MITSPANPRIKAIAALRRRRIRDRDGLFLVEGSRPVRRALDSEWPVAEILFAPDTATAQAKETRSKADAVPVTEVSDSVIRKLAYRSEPEGIVAVAEHRSFPLSDLPIDSDGLYLVTEAIEKPGNIGAILRTAEAVGVSGVIAADPATDLTNPNVVRASLGALFVVPVAVSSGAAMSEWLADIAVTPVAASPMATQTMWDTDLTGGVAIVIGSEHAGLSDAWDDCDSLRIPMEGGLDSLNAATSAALVLYEALRQRRG